MKHICIGIDVGKESLHLCPALFDATPPKSWPVIEINYKDNPNWYITIINIVADRAIVTFEPTGWHLIAPLVTVLSQMTTAQIWLCGHGTTGKARSLHISPAKTDQYDARALALIATWIDNDNPPPNCRQHNIALEQHVQRLRSLVNHRSRLVKQTTRLHNRLHAFAHALWPEIDIHYELWLPLAMRGIITPAQIQQFVADLPPDRDRRKTSAIERLARNLPPIDPPLYAIEAIRTSINAYIAADQEIADLNTAITVICLDEPFAEVTHRLMTIPYLDDPLKIAPFHVACHGLLDKLTPDEVKSCIGISALTDTSGQGDHTRAKKGGYKPAMNQLYMLAMQFCKENAPPNPIRQYHQRLKDRGDKHRPFRSTRAKLAMIISGVARSERGYQYPVQKPLPLKEKIS